MQEKEAGGRYRRQGDSLRETVQGQAVETRPRRRATLHLTADGTYPNSLIRRSAGDLHDHYDDRADGRSWRRDWPTQQPQKRPWSSSAAGNGFYYASAAAEFAPVVIVDGSPAM